MKIILSVGLGYHTEQHLGDLLHKISFPVKLVSVDDYSLLFNKIHVENPVAVFIGTTKKVEDLSGICRQLKNISHPKYLPVIVLSDNENEDFFARELYDAGADFFLQGAPGKWEFMALIRLIERMNTVGDHSVEQWFVDKTNELNERIKELNCLYSLSGLIEKEGISSDELFKGLVQIIPPAMQFPEITTVRIRINGNVFTSSVFTESSCCISDEILVYGQKKGIIEIFYTREFPGSSGCPFLNEEVKLLKDIISHVRLFLERKQETAERKKAEEDLQTTLMSIGDAVITTDESGLVTYMNPVAEKLTGWFFDQAKGKPLDEVFRIVNVKTGQPGSNPVTKVLENGLVVGLANHTQLISRKGEKYQIADSAAPIINGKGIISGIVLVFRDVTEDYRIREELAASENRYRAVFENTGTASSILEKDGTISLCNQQFSRLSGFAVNEIQNKKTLTLKQILDAAIIPNFSSQRIIQLINLGFDTPEKILNITVDQLEALPGIQITLAKKIYQGIQDR
ncbi:MAG: PAS domain S-box protein, partial [Bacteroidia bacterium]|nr:PAS domain S-box protein [Bacteroidia bacterium]